MRAFADACARTAALFREHGPQDWGVAYASVADGAQHLLGSEFNQQDLRALAEAVPGRLPWMHPKYADYNLPREPWQEEAAQHVRRAEELALSLRAVGTYDG